MDVEAVSTTAQLALPGIPSTASLLAVSVIGPTNAARGKTNQDSILLRATPYLAGIAVADGLGSCSQAHLGSSCAVHAALEVLEEIVVSEMTTSIDDLSLADLVVTRWQALLPSSHIEEFGTTLSFAAYTRGTLLTGSIGDGMVQLSMNGMLGEEHIPERNAFGNVTSSMSSSEAFKYFRIRRFSVGREHLPIIVLLATDGVADDLVSEARANLGPTLLAKLSKQGVERLKVDVEAWLYDWPTPHHQDDKSIALLALHP